MFLKQSWFSALVLAIPFFGVAWFSLHVIGHDSGIGLVWLPNSLAVAWLLHRKSEEWCVSIVGIVAAGTLANVAQAVSLGLSLGIGLINGVEVAVVAVLLRNMQVRPGPQSIRKSLKVLGANMAVIVCISGVLAAMWLSDESRSSGVVWFNWVAAHVLGSLMCLLPALLVNRAFLLAMLQPWQLAFMVLSLLFLVLTTAVIVMLAPFPFSYLALPFIVVAIYQGALRAGILANLTYLIFSIGLNEQWWTLQEPFQNNGPQGIWAACAITMFIPVILGIAIDELRHRQSRLRRLSERMALAADSIGLGVWDWDCTTRKMVVDQQLRDLFELTHDEPVSRETLRTFFQGDTYQAIASATDCHSDRNEFREKCAIRLRSGRSKTIQVSGVVMRDGSGHVIRVVGLCWDVSELESAQTAVSVAEEKLVAIVESASEYAIIATDPRGIITVFSAGAERLLGYQKQDVIRKLNPAIFHDKEEVSEYALQLEKELGYAVHGFDVFTEKARQGEVVPKAWTAIRKNGTRLPIHLTITALRDRLGSVTGYLGVARDISQEKYAEKKVEVAHAVLEQQILLAKQMRDEFESLFELAPGAMIVLDAKGIIWNANGRAHDLFGYHNGALSGVSISRLIFSNLSAPEGPAFQNAWDRQNVSDVYRARRENGDVFLANIQRSPLLVNGDAHTILIVFDVTRQKQAEQSLQRSRDLAESANKAKTEFLANMSHEIRTPLNAVLGTAQLLNFTELNAKQRHYVSMIMESGQSLSAILNDVLDISKIEAGRMELTHERFHLNKVLNALSTIMAASGAGKNLELLILVQPDFPEYLLGDAMRLQQILVNLAGNAIKFTAEGEVVVSLSQKIRDGENVELEIRVRDSGIGMTANQQKKLFRAFSQGDNSITRRFGGTGLGMTITKKLIELMHGQIVVESEYGRGTEFICRIPVQCCLSLEAESTDRLDLRPGEGTVLLMDHHDESRQNLQTLLLKQRWKVEAVANVAEALTALTQYRSRFSLLIFNGSAPSVDVLEQAASGLPCVRVSGALDKSGLEKVISLPKPVTETHLQTAVNEAFQVLSKGGDVLQNASGNLKRESLFNRQVLLVEDNELNQTVALGILEELRCRVVIANNGEEAIRILNDGQNRFDLILMDVQMPVMDGFTATRKIRQELHIDTPVIAMTAGVLAFERQQCIESGMTDFIGKPIDFEWMITVLSRNLLPGKPAMTTTEMEYKAVESTDKAVFDPGAVLKLARGKAERERAIVAMIQKMVQAQLTPLEKGREWAQQEDWQALRVHFHSVKGEFGNFGAQMVCQAAESIELALKQQDYERLDGLLDEFETHLAATLKSAAGWLKQYQASRREPVM